MDYVTESDHQRGSNVTPLDAMDTRFIHTFADLLNFTYTMHEQVEREWGVPTAGKFNGMMGELQREETDFCTIAAPTPERLEAVDYSRGYPSDVLVITSLKPTLLPANLALVRPFQGEVWASLLMGVLVWGLTLWVVQWLWASVSGGLGVEITKALMYGWGALAEQPPPDPSTSGSGQMLVGWWLVFCLVVDIGYRSSLVAHLTVQARSPTLEHFHQLLDQGSWGWGTERWLLSGAPLEYFVKNINPAVQQIYKEMQVLQTSDEGLLKVLKGRYSFISFRNYVSIAVASRYTDALGNSPFYTSRTGIPIMAAFGWGIRKGAPFHPRFSELMSRLEDAGVTPYWKDDLIAKRVRQNRAKAEEEKGGQLGQQTTPQLERREVALELNHLQGAFYLLFLGSGVGLVILLVENVVTYSCF
ncbi:hypothetical protein Pcinc_038497 [Petrolisthes cinctipes]|uniref:Uncharacterized protein n=1 Tax=Petrolisthes cinctipes TaxID=88211 RepID=A0AAE1BTL7_PETCI|nr:hypothetical protein Pcinc_038497 [Petrolisthes cinctipes]